MPRSVDEPVERIHVMIYKSDAEQLKELFGETVGVTKAIRLIVRQYLKRLSERLEETPDV